MRVLALQNQAWLNMARIFRRPPIAPPPAAAPVETAAAPPQFVDPPAAEPPAAEPQAPPLYPATPRLLGARLSGLNMVLLGTCQVDHLVEAAAEHGFSAQHHLYDSSLHGQIPAVAAEGVDLVVVGLTWRTIFREALAGDDADLIANGGAGFSDVAHARPGWTQARAERHSQAIARHLETLVDGIAAAVPARPILFFAFFEPSFAYDGLLIDPYGADTMPGLVRNANAALSKAVRRRAGAYFYDVNTPIKMIGQAHLRDDGIGHSTHASLINDWDVGHDQGRLVAPVSPFATYDVRGRLPALHAAVFDDLADIVKIIRQVDQVKLIIVDLDDTLWRGVAAEDAVEGWVRTEGWPRGFVEALLVFKKRGGLLAICSKNDEAPTLQRLAAIWGGFIEAQDFVSAKINWRPKSENIAEILAQTNLLPESVVFIDDNPREIDEVRARFPTLRCLGGNPHDWRRIILRAPETQVAAVTAESAARTELVRQRIARDASADGADRRTWLRSLDLRATLHIVRGEDDARFARAVELLNKTNQFNTTGRRWSLAEIAEFLTAGGVLLTAGLRDRTLDNGLISVALVRPGEIVQVVLSCRAFGLGVEIVVGSAATRLALETAAEAVGAIVDTGKNATCHDIFAQLDFAPAGDRFVASAACAPPDWITIETDESFAGGRAPS